MLKKYRTHQSPNASQAYIKYDDKKKNNNSLDFGFRAWSSKTKGRKKQTEKYKHCIHDLWQQRFSIANEHLQVFNLIYTVALYESTLCVNWSVKSTKIG